MANLDLLIREATADDAELIAELTRDSWANKVVPSSSGHHEAAAARRRFCAAAR